MTLPRDHYPKQIADRLHLLANMLKTRTRGRLTDANHSLETVMQGFFNALYGWNLVNLNAGQGDFPAADLGDRGRRVAMQITNEAAGSKIANTAATAHKHGLGAEFGRLIVFFLLEKKPGVPKDFVQPVGGPNLECLDITDLLKQMQQMEDLDALKRAASVLEAEMSTGVVATPLHNYFKALQDNFSTYENLGLPPPANAEGEKDVRIAIRDLFVEPTCTPGRMSPEEFDAALLTGNNPTAPLLPLLASDERRVVLLADPGMGKSTLIQWLITTLAEEALLPEKAAGLRGTIPLPFILRDIVVHLPKGVDDWTWPALLKAFVKYHPRSVDRPPLTAALAGDEASFRTLLASDRAFFLIDGLDEIGDPERRRALRDALWQGFKQYPSARWLVTSRWVGYQEAPVHEVVQSVQYSYGCGGGRGYHDHTTRHAKLLYLAPFDDRQQLTFARHWYLPRMGDALGYEHASAFVKAVREHDSVRVIGRVPNLLYLLALLYRNRAHLPHGRSLVYAAISEAYLEGIDLTKHLRFPLDLSKKERLLATIARHMQERRIAQTEDERDAKSKRKRVGEILVKRMELEQWLAPHFPGDSGYAALRTFVGYVAARSGLLLPRGEGIFGFAHLSFQEYYAACWLEEEFRRLLNAPARSGGGFLRRTNMPEPTGSLTREGFATMAAQPIWREPLVFLVEKLSANADDTLTLIDWLFPQPSEKPAAVEGKKPPELMPIEAARLLAALSLDPQVSLTLDQREAIWTTLWEAHLVQQDRMMAWHLAPSLLIPSEFQLLIWAALAPFQPGRLFLGGCSGITNLAPVARFSQLQTLDLDGCTSMVDLSPLASLTQLETLYLGGCTSLTDLSPLASFAQLETLSLNGCTGVVNLSPLASLTQLRRLSLDGCTAVVDLAPLAGLGQLQALYINDCSRVVDLAPLAKLPLLRRLDINRCTGLSKEAVAAFRQNHPEIKFEDPTSQTEISPSL